MRGLAEHLEAARAKAWPEPAPGRVEQVLARGADTEDDLRALLSPAAAPHLEAMARAAQALTLRNFGRTIQLYAPLYVSDACENTCLYCGYSARNPVPRRTLTLDEVEREAEALAATGIRHVLLLSGESASACPESHLAGAVRRMAPRFRSIGLEVQPLGEEGYRTLLEAGADSLTVYQETYDPALYAKVHPSGPKRDFRFRLETPSRGARAGLRQVNLGALLGLGDWRREVLCLALHARWMQDRHPALEVGVSLPRLRPHAGGSRPPAPVGDRDLVQILTALRLFLPRLGIAVSTRESAALRDNLVGLGVTKLSAGVSARVGGYAEPGAEVPQFEISDPRSVAEIQAMLRAKGYDPVMADWPFPPGEPAWMDATIPER